MSAQYSMFASDQPKATQATKSVKTVKTVKPAQAPKATKAKSVANEAPKAPELPEGTLKAQVIWLSEGKVLVQYKGVHYWLKTSTTKKRLPNAFTSARDGIEAAVQSIITNQGKAIGIEPIDATIEPFWLELS